MRNSSTSSAASSRGWTASWCSCRPTKPMWNATAAARNRPRRPERQAAAVDATFGWRFFCSFAVATAVQVRKAGWRYRVLAVFDFRAHYRGEIRLVVEAGAQPCAFWKEDLLPLVSRPVRHRGLLRGWRRGVDVVANCLDHEGLLGQGIRPEITCEFAQFNEHIVGYADRELEAIPGHGGDSI